MAVQREFLQRTMEPGAAGSELVAEHVKSSFSANDTPGGVSFRASTPSGQVDYGRVFSQIDSVGTQSHTEVQYLEGGSLVTGLETKVPATDETALLIRVDKSGVKSEQRVKVGAADTGGTGFRALVIDN